MLMDFLSKRCQALESIQSRTLNNQTNNTVHKQIDKSQNTSVTNIATSNLSCACCKAKHQVYHYEKFLKLSVKEKFKVVKKAHLCINCLRSTAYQAKLCNPGTCHKCNKKHNIYFVIYM